MSKVSVIIPCYNQAAYLPETLACLQAQTLPDWDCIVVNDGSTDDTEQVANQFASQDSRICVYTVPNGGSSKARRIGLQKAEGKYVQFLDSDDLITPDKLEKQVALMEQTGAKACYTNYCHFKSIGKEKKLIPHPIRTATITGSFRFSLLTRWGMDFSIPIHAFLFERTFISETMPKDDSFRYREDWNMHLAVAKAGVQPIAMTDCMGALYRDNPSSKTAEPFRLTDGNILFIAQKTTELSMAERLLWAYRLSSELWLLFGRMLKYRGWQGLKSLRYPFGNIHSFSLLLAAIILLPLSLLMVIIRTIRVY